MKKLFIGIFIIILIFIIVGILPDKKIEYDYLRLHIKANSNMVVDQNVKYEIKNLMVEMLTPELCTIETKQKAVDVIENNRNRLVAKCVEILRKFGLNYPVNISIGREYFPTRAYDNTVLESGYYDAVVVNLGEGEGDNWWCVMYPPLCFVNKNENVTQIKYKSILHKWWQKLFG